MQTTATRQDLHDAIDEITGVINSWMRSVDERFNSVEARLEHIEARFDQLGEKFAILEEKIDRTLGHVDKFKDS